nr:CDP-glycerol glycerophosphotransferase family protein [Leucobacter aridicollis]
MPRLEIMRRSVGDTSILEKLGLDPTKPLVVWAPTYRVTRRGREVRVSGVPLGIIHSTVSAKLFELMSTTGAALVVKVHPQDADSYSSFGPQVFDSSSLRTLEITSYELFGVAAQVVTDYSSIYLEREHVGLEYLLFRPDYAAFEGSYRGLRG